MNGEGHGNSPIQVAPEVALGHAETPCDMVNQSDKVAAAVQPQKIEADDLNPLNKADKAAAVAWLLSVVERLNADDVMRLARMAEVW